MPATFDFGAQVASTANAATYVSGTFTPTGGGLLFLASGCTDTVAAGSVTDSLGGAWTKVTSGLYQSSAGTMYLFVRNSLTTATAMTVTMDVTGDNATGCNFVVAEWTTGWGGRVGLDAVRQFKVVENQTAGTPALTFDAACLTDNPTNGFVDNLTNPATMTPPTGWTETMDVGHNTPPAGKEGVHRASGFTGSTITWGSASASAFGAMIVEFDNTAPAATTSLIYDPGMKPALIVR